MTGPAERTAGGAAPGGPREGADGPLRPALDRLLRRLGGPAHGGSSLLAAWPDLVGEEIARHATPVRVGDGELVVAVSDPLWATQLRWLEADLLRRVREGGGPPLDRLTLRVRPR
jgi:predicted nucleic acid-binding Zn ribbon protein